MSPKLIVVIGATGNQGSSVINTFLPDPSYTIRGLTRNTSSPAAQSLTARGVQMVPANLDSIPSLLSAFRGAHTIFSMTDFWTGFFDPANKSKLAPGQTLLEWAHDYELQQGKNIFVAASQTQGLERLVHCALSHASKWSGGKYKHVYHYDSEARAVEFAGEMYPDLMRRTSLVQIGVYLTNMLLHPRYQPKKDTNGIYTITTPLPPTCKLPLIAPAEDTGPLIKALSTLPPDKPVHLLAYRERITLPQFVQTWGEVLGVQTRYEQLGPGEPWAGLPEELRLDLEEAVAYMAQFGFEGGIRVLWGWEM
ncbi:hypothetical protein OHC33_001569 [Knufia fluminis]|uniref:NmrA-like domain-containing protein n=1 Tax=Knufia fluminis TaxID=191047 RepID=A0AAN8EK29_9EURO|nr:hypothetical protein OHC33_001569 [Knufia fluminis]